MVKFLSDQAIIDILNMLIENGATSTALGEVLKAHHRAVNAPMPKESNVPW